MIYYKLNKDQRKLVSDFLVYLSIAWFSGGIIAPLFLKIEDVVKFVVQVIFSSTISLGTFIVAIKNLENKKK